MERKPLITKAWVRIILFILTLLTVFMLLDFMAGILLDFIKNGKVDAGSMRNAVQNVKESNYLIRVLISTAAFFISVYIFRKKVERRSLYSLGFELKNHWSYAATGFFLGLLLLGIGTFVLILHKNLQWTDITFNAGEMFNGFMLMLLIAFGEELVFRGYILNNLLQSANKWAALVISAVLFAVFHLDNPSINILPAINIFLAGLMLGINYIYTRNLWFGILLHFTWNFYMGCILGYKVSGLAIQSLFQQEMSGNTLLTGGSFGFEGSVVESVICILTVTALVLIYNRKSSQALQQPPVT